MDQQQDFQAATIIVTEKAVKRLKAVMSSEGKEDHVLRMSVEGGGCSGMSYKMDFDMSQGDFDKVFETNGLPFERAIFSPLNPAFPNEDVQGVFLLGWSIARVTVGIV